MSDKEIVDESMTSSEVIESNGEQDHHGDVEETVEQNISNTIISDKEIVDESMSSSKVIETNVEQDHHGDVEETQVLVAKKVANDEVTQETVEQDVSNDGLVKENGDVHISVESKPLLDANYPDFVEKYFSKHYCSNVKETGDDYCVLVHSNRVCILTLADSHSLKTSGKVPLKVDFQISDKINRRDNAMTGKGKRGAQQVDCSSVICNVSCEDGSNYAIHAAVPGKLLDINMHLVDEPSDILNQFVAIIIPTVTTFEAFNLPLKNDDGFFDVDCDS